MAHRAGLGLAHSTSDGALAALGTVLCDKTLSQLQDRKGGRKQGRRVNLKMSDTTLLQHNDTPLGALDADPLLIKNK